VLQDHLQPPIKNALPITKDRQGKDDTSTLLSSRYSALLILLSEGIGLM